MTVKTENKQQILKEEELMQGNISLILNSYDDLFSGFDPRAYSEKMLSDDFLFECRRAVRDREEGFEFRLMIPAVKRNFSHEIMIKKRLKGYFHKHFSEKINESNTIKKEGLIWAVVGILLIFCSTLIYMNEGFIFNMLFVIFEPAGWFTLWSGLDKVFFSSKFNQKDIIFYKKMSNAQIIFIGY